MISENEIYGRLTVLKDIVMFDEKDLLTGKFEDVREQIEKEIFMRKIEIRTLSYVLGINS